MVSILARRSFLLLSILLGSISISHWAFGQTESSTISSTGKITVHVDQPTVELPATLYGLFYEDINYAADGGIYAELVQNRSFEYYPVTGWNKISDRLHPLYAWEKVETGNSQFGVSVVDAKPLNSKNTHYLSLEIEKPGDGVGIVNNGFGGIRIVEGGVYDFSFYAKRSASLDSPVHVSLQSNDDSIGGGTIAGLSSNWKKYELTLTATKTTSDARLMLMFADEGVIDMDMVSLFPRETFKGRKNGLRADLVQALADLKPAMFRFPGGCIVHGHGLENAYRWKDTIGDVAQRKPNWNLWGYHQSYGLGYFEYFQLCEDIGAEPMPIIPVGVSCGFLVPFQNAEMGQLQEWVDDAVDLVEFANGSVDSKWGKIRAEMGHPAPFNLKYIGLGNEEHHTPQFEERFPHFVRAMRSKTPEIELVGTSGLGPEIPIYEFMNKQGCEFSDEHYYESPEWFLSQTHRFDNFDRNKTKVFVGEYASKGNQLFNAIAEAAYLTGIERNADIVPMTAYAPLFARYGFTQWETADLIWFDEKSVVRTPNYYVQQLFSVNKGDEYLANEAKFNLTPNEFEKEKNAAIGQFGVGTWGTAAMFDDVKVVADGKTLLTETFDENLETDNRIVIDGSFKAANGVYEQSDVTTKPATSLFPQTSTSDSVTYSLRAKKTGGAEGFVMVFGHKPSGSYYWWNVGGWSNTEHGLQRANASTPENRQRIASAKGAVETDVWYDVRIELTPKRIKCYLDDKLIHDYELEEPTISVAASKDNATGEVILKIVNPLEQSCETQIELAGVDQTNPTATLTVLAGEKSDANDLENPERVSPKVSEINVAKTFPYTIPPMSVQFIRIGTTK